MASNQPVLFPVLIDAATDPLVRAVAVCLARYWGQTCVHTESDLRDFLVWCRERGLEPLNASRAQVELYVRWMQEVRNFHALVSRRMANGERFHPRQRMTREEALAAYTINAAHAAFEEQVKGSLTRGKLADIVVLSQDILTVPDDRIPETEVLYTIVGGEVLYTHPEL